MISLPIPPLSRNGFPCSEIKPDSRNKPSIGYMSQELKDLVRTLVVTSARTKCLHSWAKTVCPTMRRVDVFKDPEADIVSLYEVYYALSQQPTPSHTGILHQHGTSEFFLGDNTCLLVYPYKKEDSSWGLTTVERDTGLYVQQSITGSRRIILPHPNYHDRRGLFDLVAKERTMSSGGDVGAGY